MTPGTVNAYVAFRETGAVNGVELAGVIHGCAAYITNDILPMFERFFWR